MTESDERQEREDKAEDLEQRRKGRAIGLADEATKKAVELAVEKALNDAHTKVLFERIDSHFKTLNGDVRDMEMGLKKIEECQDQILREQIAMKTKLAFYATIGALVGSGAMSLIVLRAGG